MYVCMIAIVRCVLMKVLRSTEPVSRAANDADSVPFHDFFSALVQALPRRGGMEKSSFFVEIRYRDAALDRIVRVHRSEKREGHFACNKIKIAADLCRQCGGEEILCHQTALFIGLYVVNGLITGEISKQPDFLFRECPAPRHDIANVHSIDLYAGGHCFKLMPTVADYSGPTTRIAPVSNRGDNMLAAPPCSTIRP
jgi:hypothetical protein